MTDDEIATPGWALVRTNGMVPDGVYDLDTSADGYYLNPLFDPDDEVVMPRVVRPDPTIVTDNWGRVIRHPAKEPTE